MLWTVITAVALVTGAWFISRPARDPVYQGQRLSVWFDQLQPLSPLTSARAANSTNLIQFNARTREQRENAREAIQKMGPAAVPFLVDRLRARDSYWKKKYREFYFSRARRWPRWIASCLPAPRQDTGDMTQMNAVMALGWLGDAAKPAAPELAKAMSDEWSFSGFEAGRVLAALGPSAREAIPTLIATLRAKNPHVANDAVSVIVSVAHDSPEIIPVLARMLGEQDAVKIRVLQLLPRLGQSATGAERDIQSLVASTNGSVRFAVITALWDIFPRRHLELLPKLEEFARSPDKNMRESAGLKLVGMQPLTERAAELLTVVVRNGGEGFCWSAFTMLGKRGREASNAIPALIEGLNAKEPRVAAKAAAALGEIARPDKETTSALEKARLHDYLMVREAAGEAIQKIQSKPD